MKSLDACIAGYLTQVEKRKNVDYADKASVRKYNAAYDKCFHFAKYIDNHYPEHLDMLVDLLEHPDIDVVGHCAPMILRLQHATTEQKAKAIEAIYKLLDRPEVDDVTKLGFTMSLEKWEKEFKEKN